MKRPFTGLAVALALASGSVGCCAFDPNVGYLNDASGSSGGGEGGGGSIEDDGVVRFWRDIRPIIDRPFDHPSKHGCRSCHYSTEPQHVGYDLGGLDLSTLGALRKGGATSGSKIVIAGRPDDSVLVQKLRGTYGFGAPMPRGGAKWGEDELGLLVEWIAAGAAGADDE